jgi:hypothetical protein
VKYDYEIQSYIGNFFLRITSDKMMSLVTPVEPRTLSQIFQDPSNNLNNRDLISALSNLGETVKSKLQNMEMGEALQEIVDVLKLVRTSRFPFTPSHYPLPGQYGNDDSCPLVSRTPRRACVLRHVPRNAPHLWDLPAAVRPDRRREIARCTWCPCTGAYLGVHYAEVRQAGGAAGDLLCGGYHEGREILRAATFAYSEIKKKGMR